MQDAATQTIHLADYRPYPFRLAEVDLTFRLAPGGNPRSVAHPGRAAGQRRRSAAGR